MHPATPAAPPRGRQPVAVARQFVPPLMLIGAVTWLIQVVLPMAISANAAHP